MKRMGLMALAVGAVCIASPAFAQGPAAKAPVTVRTTDYVETQAIDGGQVVEFPGDPLPVSGMSAYGDLVRPPPKVVRAGLLRPRMNFLSELLKSVENL